MMSASIFSKSNSLLRSLHPSLSSEIKSSSRLAKPSSLLTNTIFRVSLSSFPGGGEKREAITFLHLGNLTYNPGAVKKKRRVGRGIGSSKGKTCGRGHKGQRARGSVHPTFEGGQTKFYKRIPKRGFTNAQAAEPMVPVNVGTIQDYIDMGRITLPESEDDPPLTMVDLINSGIVKRNMIKFGMKLLADGKDRLRSPLRIEISRASREAIQAVESIPGGEVVTVHYNKLALKALLKPERFVKIPRRAKPPPRLLPYYNNDLNRGYLSPMVQLRKVMRGLDEIFPLEEEGEEKVGSDEEVIKEEEKEESVDAKEKEEPTKEDEEKEK